MPLGANKAAIMGVAGVSGEDVVLLASTTDTDSSGIAFTTQLTSTYGEYIFRFYDINLETNNEQLEWQANASGESGYNETITSTFWKYVHSGNDSYVLGYNTGDDQANGTAYQSLIENAGSDADETCAGELHLFNPASTTFAKAFISTLASSHENGGELANFGAGYINTTAAITGINFKSSSGNFDGTIKLWGVK